MFKKKMKRTNFYSFRQSDAVDRCQFTNMQMRKGPLISINFKSGTR